MNSPLTNIIYSFSVPHNGFDCARRVKSVYNRLTDTTSYLVTLLSKRLSSDPHNVVKIIYITLVGTYDEEHFTGRVILTSDIFAGTIEESDMTLNRFIGAALMVNFSTNVDVSSPQYTNDHINDCIADYILPDSVSVSGFITGATTPALTIRPEGVSMYTSSLPVCTIV